ncbi:MAG: DUF3108 domain-containing protein [Gammaproteobacteria bacterium]|nr:DUF3108 domain-containing protein [Gammaproteobacteria bacterium]
MKNTFITFLLLLATSVSAQDFSLALATPNMPPAFTAEYAVKVSGMNVGTLDVNLSQTDPENWTYHSSSSALGLAAMFVGSNAITDTSKLTLLDGTIRPMFYERIRKTKSVDKSERVFYQWHKQLAQSEYKDRKQEINLTDLTTDKFTLQLLIMANIKNIPEKITLPVISKAKLKEYQIVNLGEVKLNTIYGERDTILIERIKDDSSYRIWADPASHGLPLQIERIKEGKTEYIVKIQDSSLHEASEKITMQSTNLQQPSYYQPR